MVNRQAALLRERRTMAQRRRADAYFPDTVSRAARSLLRDADDWRFAVVNAPFFASIYAEVLRGRAAEIIGAGA